MNSLSYWLWCAKAWTRYQLMGECGLACGDAMFRRLDGTPFTMFVPEADCPIHDKPLMNFMARFRVAWRILWGKSGMYGVDFRGKVKLNPRQDVHVIACKFEPDTAELRADGGQDSSNYSGG